jgi:DNA (cytosine-5)-methyltransferase 1
MTSVLVRPRLLDLYCGAGGAAMGYHRAGFEVVGVDIKPQPRYPFKFFQADALVVLDSILKGVFWFYDIGHVDAIHASPPCPRYSMMTRVAGNPADHPDLVEPTRELLRATGLPYVIENVPGSPLEDPVRLCGSWVGLGATCRDGKYRQLRRHRLFEANFTILVQPCCHDGEPVGVYGNGGGQQKTVWNGGSNRGYMATKAEAEEALGIDWMIKAELSNAIPPAYTELIGHQLMAHIQTCAISSS